MNVLMKENKNILEIKTQDRMKNKYFMSVDKEVYDFVNQFLHGTVCDQVTIGYLTEEQQEKIEMLTGIKYFAPRCVLSKNAVSHILNRHGVDGVADKSMADIRNIARMPFVFANFDCVEFNGRTTNAYKTKDGSPAPLVVLSKKIDGMYYIIEAVCDGKAGKSYIVTAYLTAV